MPSLLSRIKRGVGSIAKVAGSILPGPVGLAAKGVGALLGGGGVPRPAKLPSGVMAAMGGGGGVPTSVRRAAEGLLVGLGTATAGVAGGPGAAALFGGAVTAGLRAFGPAMPGPGGTGTGTQIAKMPVTTDLMSVQFEQVARAPKGFRVHTVTPSTAPLVGLQPGSKVAVRLGSFAARQLGVKRSKRPVISIGDSEAIKRAARAKKKAGRLAKQAGLYVANTRPKTTQRRLKAC